MIMESLAKITFSFVFLFNTAVLTSLPAQSEKPSNFMKIYSVFKSSCFKRQAIQNCKPECLYAFNKVDNVFAHSLNLQKRSMASENCRCFLYSGLRRWFHARNPYTVMFFRHFYHQTDSEVETCLHYKEKHRHTFLAQINMDSFRREKVMKKH